MSLRMVRSGFWRVHLAMCVSLLGAAPVAAEDESPSGHELIQRFIDVCGGREAYAKIRNRAIAAKVDLPDHGTEGEFIEIIVPPNYRRIIAVDIYDPNVIGLTGEIPWRLSPSGERVTIKNVLAADTRRHGQLNPFLDWNPESGEAKVVGDASIEEDACFRVEVKPVKGSILLAFFSKETGLLRRIDDRAANMYRHFGDYRKVDGVLIPHDVQIDAGMMMLHFEFLAIEQNVDLTEFIGRGLLRMFSAERMGEILGVADDGTLSDSSD